VLRADLESTLDLGLFYTDSYGTDPSSISILGFSETKIEGFLALLIQGTSPAGRSAV
jgi:hypothetical protein